MKNMPGPDQHQASPLRSRLRLPMPVAATLLLGSAITLALFFAVSAFEYDHVQSEFKRRAGNRFGALQSGFNEAAEELSTINRLFVVNPALSREEFAYFTAPILERAPYIRAIVFQRVVRHEERAAFVAARRRERAFSDITELVDGKLVSATVRPAYRVVDYVEPLAGNRMALGLDAASRREQAGAAQRACASGETTMTGLYPLVLGGSDREGVALLRPVYRSGPVAAGAARCDALTGHTAVLLSIGRFVFAALDGRGLLRPEGFNVSLYDGGLPLESRLAQRIGAPPRAADTRPLLVRIALSRTPDTVYAPIKVAGRTWLAAISPEQHRPTDFLAAIVVAAGGLLVTLLAAIQANILVVRTRNVSKLVDERTAALVNANRKLKLLDQAIEASVSGTVIINAQAPYVIEYVNPAFEKMLGYSAAEVVGRESGMLLKREDGRRDVPEIREALAAQREAHVSLRVLRNDGVAVWTDMYIAPVRDAAGAVSHFVIAHYDITDKKRSEDELVFRANHDNLTGLANRRLLVEKLRDMIAVAARRRGAIWLMFIDLDRFKRINDSLSHRVGDEFLKLMAERLRASVREVDVVARLHGDEFLIAFPDTGNPPAIALIVQRVMARLAEPITVAGHELTVSCSAGVAKYPGDGDTPDALIDNADIAMYKAKEQGRNNVQCFEAGMNEHVQERLRLERALRLALERGEFVLHYQPQFDLASGALVGLEALLRWESAQFGTVAPARFIALAAETGLIVPIGDWVLRTACAQAEAWRAAGLGSPRIAVNLSARQFRQPELVQTVAAALRDTGLAPSRLELELTETLVMDEDIGDAVQVMRRLRELGVGLSVDDFGTGYSSLACLKEFPVEVLKIDHSFVRDIKPYSHDTSIPDAIISMAHSLGMRVIAEGVESEAQCEFLARNMCDEVQGYLFSLPLAADAMEAYLREGHTVPEHLRRMYKRQPTLLLVDDEPNILSALRRLIRGSGYKILTASSGIEGLEVLAQNEVDVIVSDQRMPGMTGVDFLRNVKQLHPDTVRIVLSGFTELQSVTDAVNEGAIYKFLTKPWDDVQLRGHIDEAFAHKQMADENRRLGLEVRTANHGLAQANRQLESVLRKQERQIERDEIVLDVVREGLQNVPLPIIGLADDMLVAFANHAARRLFASQGMLLGADAAQAMPGLVLAIQGLANGQSCAVEVEGRPFMAEVRHTGQSDQMRGILITLVPQEAAAALREAAQAQVQPT